MCTARALLRRGAAASRVRPRKAAQAGRGSLVAVHVAELDADKSGEPAHHISTPLPDPCSITPRDALIAVGCFFDFFLVLVLCITVLLFLRLQPGHDDFEEQQHHDGRTQRVEHEEREKKHIA